jgi:hypothetical protein
MNHFHDILKSYLFPIKERKKIPYAHSHFIMQRISSRKTSSCRLLLSTEFCVESNTFSGICITNEFGEIISRLMIVIFFITDNRYLKSRRTSHRYNRCSLSSYCTITNLDLAWNNISPRGAFHLSKALEKNTVRKYLFSSFTYTPLVILSGLEGIESSFQYHLLRRIRTFG